MKPWQGIALALGLLIMYGLAGTADVQDEQAQRDRYCDMIELWAETGGDAGWPPYNGKCED